MGDFIIFISQKFNETSAILKNLPETLYILSVWNSSEFMH